MWASLRQHLRAPSLFWRFNPREPAAWVDSDVGGLAAFFHAALDLRAQARVPAEPAAAAAGAPAAP